MKNPKEEIVDRVLQGLRDTEPPPGMESRIVGALQHRASAMPAKSRPTWREGLLTGSLVLASVVCALLLSAQRKTPHTPVPNPQNNSTLVLNGAPIGYVSVQQEMPEPSPHRKKRMKAVPPRERVVVLSYPAPPMPLTEQERLLLRLAHKGEPVQLAMLDPVQREARYADERTQVQIFFTTKTGDNQ